MVAKSKCSRCRRHWYCSPQCQRQDWADGHKDVCTPFCTSCLGTLPELAEPAPTPRSTLTFNRLSEAELAANVEGFSASAAGLLFAGEGPDPAAWNGITELHTNTSTSPRRYIPHPRKVHCRHHHDTAVSTSSLSLSLWLDGILTLRVPFSPGEFDRNCIQEAVRAREALF